MKEPNDLDYFLDMESPPALAVVKDYVRRSRALAAQADVEADLPYGDLQPSQRFSVVWPAHREDTCLALLFFHGGWWKAGNKEDRLFLAENLLPENIALVSVGYPLAPAHPLSTLAESAEQAVRRATEHLRGHLGRTLPMVLSGNSAGAHLAACAAGALANTAERAAEHGIVGLSVASGLYDLAPMRQGFPNRWLSLGVDDVASLSPIHRLPAPRLPMMISAGAREPAGFLAQKALYLQRLREAGAQPQDYEAPDHDHFTVIGEFGRVGQPLHDWLLRRRDEQGA